MNILIDHSPDDGLMRPEAVEKRWRMLARGDTACQALGPLVPPFPLIGLLSEPIKIVQSPRLTMVLYEAGNLYRQVYTDGRAFPEDFAFPAFNGYSVRPWEGDRFVVETAGFNDGTILDILRHPHSDVLHVIERFRRRDFGHLDYELTFDDPKMYTKPFTIQIPHELLADSDIFENYLENEKDCAHIGKN